MNNPFQSAEDSKMLAQLRGLLQLADREWKKLLKRKDNLSSKQLELFNKLIKVRAKLHTMITKIELESLPINQILKALGVK
jgi:hypothetical protein